VVGAIVGLLLLVVLAGFLLSESLTVRFEPVPKALGIETPVQVAIDSPHGIRRVTAWVEQTGRRYRVFEITQSARRWPVIGEDQAPQTITFPAGKNQAPELIDGQAELIVEAVANDMRAHSAEIRTPVQVSLTPPAVSADGFQHYINQGGAELVTFTVSGYWTEAGVRVGPYTFRSFPMPGKSESERFSLFAFPWDVPADTIPVVYVRNPS